MNRTSPHQPEWVFRPSPGHSLAPANGDYRNRFQASFKGQQMLKLLGVGADEVEPGAVRLSVPYREELTQQHGMLHGGLVGMLLDTACGFAALTLFPPGTAVLVVEYKVNFLRPAVGAKLVARGQVIKPGKTLTVCVGEAHSITQDGSSNLVATSQSTMMLMPAGPDIAEG
jgi:uncharacterized protein (TIGR00369 family)